MSKKFLVTSLAALSLSIFAGPSVFAEETGAVATESTSAETGSQAQSLEELFAAAQALDTKLSSLFASEEPLPVSPENRQLLSDSINDVNNLLAALRDNGAKVEDAKDLFELRTNLAKLFLLQYEMPGLYEAILTQVPTLETKRYDDAVDFHDFDAELDSLLEKVAELDAILDFVQEDLEAEDVKKDKAYLNEVALYLIRLQEELYAPEGETVKVPEAPVYWNEEAVPVIDSEAGNNGGTSEESVDQGSTEPGTDTGTESPSDTTDTGSIESAEETGETEPGTDTGTESPSDTTDTGSTEVAEETGDQGSTEPGTDTGAESPSDTTDTGSTEVAEETGDQVSTEPGTDTGAESPSDTTDTGSTEVAEETGDQGSTEPGTDTGTESPSDTTDTGSTESAEESGDQGSTEPGTDTGTESPSDTTDTGSTEVVEETGEVAPADAPDNSAPAESGSTGSRSDSSGSANPGAGQTPPPAHVPNSPQQNQQSGQGQSGQTPSSTHQSTEASATAATSQTKAVLPTTADETNEFYLLAGLFLASLGLASMKRRQA